MSIFDNPLEAANWLRRCEADKLRADTARYERQHPEEDEEWSECPDCKSVLPVMDMEDGNCNPCWKKRDSIEAMEER